MAIKFFVSKILVFINKNWTISARLRFIRKIEKQTNT